MLDARLATCYPPRCLFGGHASNLSLTPEPPPHRPSRRPLSRRSELEGKLRELADALAADMAAEGGLRGKTVTLKLKLSTFEVGEEVGGWDVVARRAASRCSSCLPLPSTRQASAVPWQRAADPNPLHNSLQLRTRATTLPTYVHTAEELYTVGLRLLRAEMPCELRLLGG